MESDRIILAIGGLIVTISGALIAMRTKGGFFESAKDKELSKARQEGYKDGIEQTQRLSAERLVWRDKEIENLNTRMGFLEEKDEKKSVRITELTKSEAECLRREAALKVQTDMLAEHTDRQGHRIEELSARADRLEMENLKLRDAVARISPGTTESGIFRRPNLDGDQSESSQPSSKPKREI